MSLTTAYSGIRYKFGAESCSGKLRTVGGSYHGNDPRGRYDTPDQSPSERVKTSQAMRSDNG